MSTTADTGSAAGVTVRPARADDAESIAQVHVASWQTAYRGILPDSYLDTLNVSRRLEMWQELLTRPKPGTFNFVAEDASGALVGFASGGPARAHIALPGDPAVLFDGELYGIYLLAEHRGQGVGRRLTTNLAQAMADYGYRTLLVWVLAANPACAFYEALGAVRVGQEDITLAGLVLPELAYGWTDIAVPASHLDGFEASASQVSDDRDTRPARASNPRGGADGQRELRVELITYTDARAFVARARPALEEAEAANNLMIGIANRLVEHPERFKQPPYLATVADGDAVVAAAVMTPPNRVILHSSLGEDPAPLRLIMADLRAGGWAVPGVVGPSVPAKAFAELWQAETGRPYRPGMSERVYELRQVFPPVGVPGHLRPARAEELPLLVEWIIGFNRDAHLTPDDPATISEHLTQRIEAGEYFIWDDGGPTSVAGTGRHTTHGMAIGPVYTPPELRNRGYASACVAALSQHLLDGGWQFCCLFTDLANPTSNSIYQRIGYRPVCDFNEYNFE